MDRQPANRKPYLHESAWKACNVGGKAGISEPLNEGHIAAFDNALQPLLERGVDAEQITREDFPLDAIQEDVTDKEEFVQRMTRQISEM